MMNNLLSLVPAQFTQSPDGLLWSNAVTATGILLKRGLVVPPTAVAITAGPAISATGLLNPLTAAAHGLSVGDEVTIAGVTSTPTVNGTYVVTSVPTVNTFTITFVCTVAGSAWGTVQQIYAAVGELVEVDPGGSSRNKIPTSNHNDGYSSTVLGILQNSDPSIKINFVGSNATHLAVRSDLAANIKNNWKFLFPSGTYRLGLAYVQAFKFDNVPVDGKQGAACTFVWASQVTEFNA